MNQKSYSTGTLKIENGWLKFPSGEAARLSEITNLRVIWKPKKKIWKGIIIWILIFYIVSLFGTSDGIPFYIGLFMIVTGPFLLYDSLKYNKYQAKTALEVYMKSGRRILVESKDRYFLDKLENTIQNSILSESSHFQINLNNSGIINIGENIHNRF